MIGISSALETVGLPSLKLATVICAIHKFSPQLLLNEKKKEIRSDVFSSGFAEHLSYVIFIRQLSTGVISKLKTNLLWL